MTVYDIPDFSSSNILLVSSENDVADVHQHVARFGGREPQHGVHGPLKKNENKTRKKKNTRQKTKQNIKHSHKRTNKKGSEQGQRGERKHGRKRQGGQCNKRVAGGRFPYDTSTYLVL